MTASSVLKDLPAPLRQLTDQISTLAEQCRLRVALVGGVVRDLLYGTPLTPDAELDVLVEGDGPAFASRLAQELHGTLHRHPAFLTARVDWTAPDGTARHLDVATARTERYPAPGALPIVSPASMEQDLARRDFTINAMAIRLDPPYAGQLLDPFAGRADLTAGRIRVLHDRSFEDDPTRMFRAARFAARYDLTLDVRSATQLVRALPALACVSGTRIRHELELVAAERDPAAVLARLGAWGVLAALHPALVPDAVRLRLVQQLLAPDHPLSWQAAADPYLLVASALLHDCPPEALAGAAYRLSLSAPELKRFYKTATLLGACTAELAAQQLDATPRLSALHALITALPPEGLCLLAATGSTVSRELIEKTLTRGKAIPLSGNDLLAMGIPPGAVCGRLLQELRTAWLDGKAQDRTELVRLAHRLAAQLMPERGTPALPWDLHPDRLPCTKKDTGSNGHNPFETEEKPSHPQQGATRLS